MKFEAPDDIDIEKLRLDGNLLDVERTVYDTANNNITNGCFTTEQEAEDWLCDFLVRTQSFSVRRQLEGRPIFRHHDQEWKDVRCDVLAIPVSGSQIATGAIVLEAKRSGEKIGPGISQLMDYLHSVFQVRNSIGIVPTLGFLFPCPKQHGASASWMQHQHLGTAEVRRGGLVLFCGEQRLLEFSSQGDCVFCNQLKSGKKLGSR